MVIQCKFLNAAVAVRYVACCRTSCVCEVLFVFGKPHG